MPRSQADALSGCGDRRLRVILPALVAAVFLLYLPTVDSEFLHLDDSVYLTDNPMVQEGLTPRAVAWAFTTLHAANWHPLTWLSHLLDVAIFGLHPAGHHFVNVLLHATNAGLLLALLAALTGSLWPSALTAALFALHPLNVESVAWVAERKNLLSTLFWLLAMAAYLRRLRRPAAHGPWLVLLLAILGLMSKPMLVTLPITLLLLDWWPLGRLRPGGSAFSQLVAEKVPLLLLATAVGIITVAAQGAWGALASLTAFPVGARAANALTAVIGYLGKALSPTELTVFYPHLGGRLPWWHNAATAVLLAVLTVVAFRVRRRAPTVLWGWLWFLVTLVPVSGLIQVGRQGIADRYAYVPFLGLFAAVSWSLPLGSGSRSAVRACARCGAIGCLAMLFVLTARQVPVWKDDIALYTQLLRVHPGYLDAHHFMARALRVRGRADEALRHEQTALALCPECWDSHFHMGNHLLKAGQVPEALESYREAARLAPERSDVRNNLGVALALLGRAAEAESAFADSVRLDERNHEAQANLGKVLLARGEAAAARRHLERALTLAPRFADAHRLLGELLEAEGRAEEAREHLDQAARFAK